MMSPKLQAYVTGLRDFLIVSYDVLSSYQNTHLFYTCLG